MFKGFAIPRVRGRGAGLGNEMFLWGKAFIAGKTLGLKTLHPAFGLNQRGYWRYFGTSRLDWASHAALRKVLPHYAFHQADYQATGETELGAALTSFAAHQGLIGKSAYVLSVEGLWGGFELITPAREFLRAKLLNTRWTLANLFVTERKLRPDALTVGIHIRRGDFAPTTDTESYRGKFNLALPLDWYVNIARNLLKSLGSEINIVVVSDARSEDLKPFGTEIPCIFTEDQDNRDVSDLITLSKCDLIVCSISSYSLWAAFLSSGRYIWPSANLTTIDGFASIWGHEVAQAGPYGPTYRARQLADLLGTPEHPKGISVAWDGVVDEALMNDLKSRQQSKRRDSDLLRFGVLPVSRSTSTNV